MTRHNTSTDVTEILNVSGLNNLGKDDIDQRNSTQTPDLGPTQDSPGSGLDDDSYDLYTRSDTFSTYVLWSATPGDTLVPICKVDWSWSGGAQVGTAGNWSANGPLNRTQGPACLPATSYPAWVQNAFDFIDNWENVDLSIGQKVLTKRQK